MSAGKAAVSVSLSLETILRVRELLATKDFAGMTFSSFIELAAKHAIDTYQEESKAELLAQKLQQAEEKLADFEKKVGVESSTGGGQP